MQIGKSATVSTIVSEKNTAKAVGSGSLEVFATPMMIALMEQAACECLAESLEPGQTSVGTVVNVGHTEASPIGAIITATATIVEINVREISFVVSASCGENSIGKGTHTRVIINTEKFISKVYGK